jgi:sigma-B regulation protein RsbU (phosphoserine phosphatase)
VHANSVNTILTGSFVRDLGWPWVVAIEIILISAVIVLSVHRSALLYSLASLGLAGSLFTAAGVSIFIGNLLIPVIKPLLILFLGWTGLSTLNAVQNARTQAEIERARRVAERELEIGRKIQAGFLPARLPTPDGWQIAAHFQPALQVSGDFYDVFELAGGRCIGIVIADVCDHGVGSALFMALTRSLIRAFALQNADRLAVQSAETAGWSPTLALDTVRQTNAYITDNHDEAGMFATLFLGILDPNTGSLTYVNGGHEPPVFLRHSRTPVYLKATGLAVGALPETTYTSNVIQFEPGDRLILYTDGLTDAESEAAAHFSKERLVQLIFEDTADAQAIVDRVIRALNVHVGSGSPADDVTLVSIYRSHSRSSG